MVAIKENTLDSRIYRVGTEYCIRVYFVYAYGISRTRLETIGKNNAASDGGNGSTLIFKTSSGLSKVLRTIAGALGMLVAEDQTFNGAI